MFNFKHKFCIIQDYVSQVCKSLEEGLKIEREELDLQTYPAEQIQQKDDDKNYEDTQKKEIERLKEELNEKTHELCRIKQENEELKTSFNSLNENIEQHKKELNEKDQKLCGKEEDNKGLNTTIKLLEEKIQQLENAYDELDKELCKVQKENDDLKKKKGKPNKGNWLYFKLFIINIQHIRISKGDTF